MIVDAHNDLLLELALRREEENPFARHWLPKLRAGGVALQVCPIFTADRPAGEHRAAGMALRDAWERALDRERATTSSRSWRPTTSTRWGGTGGSG